MKFQIHSFSVEIIITNKRKLNHNIKRTYKTTYNNILTSVRTGQVPGRTQYLQPRFTCKDTFITFTIGGAVERQLPLDDRPFRKFSRIRSEKCEKVAIMYVSILTANYVTRAQMFTS